MGTTPQWKPSASPWARSEERREKTHWTEEERRKVGGNRHYRRKQQRFFNYQTLLPTTADFQRVTGCWDLMFVSLSDRSGQFVHRQVQIVWRRYENDSSRENKTLFNQKQHPSPTQPASICRNSHFIVKNNFIHQRSSELRIYFWLRQSWRLLQQWKDKQGEFGEFNFK